MPTPRPNLEGMPPAILDIITEQLPPESAAALTLVSHTMASNMAPAARHVQAVTARRELLRLLEPCVPMQVYCPWCDILHAPETCLSSEKSRNGQGCQLFVPFVPKPFLYSSCPAEYHPLLLYGIVKQRKEGRDTTPLESRLSIDRPVDVARGVVDGFSWRAQVNDRGIFLRERRTFVVTGGRDPWTLSICNHCSVTLEFPFANIDTGVRINITCSQPTHNHQGVNCDLSVTQTHGCISCHRDFRCELVLASQQATAIRPNYEATFTVSTWFYLGRGESPDFVRNNLMSPHLLTPQLGQAEDLGIGNVAAYSGIPE
jgi:hypothetical protein